MKPNSKVLLALGLSLSAVFLGIILFARVKEVNVKTFATWEEPPVLCISKEFNQTELHQALEWWADLGYTFERSCETHTGSLQIDPTIDQRDSYDDVSVTHGLTSLSVKDGKIYQAESKVLPGSDALVIAHELGHLLGFRHPNFCPTGHILHPHNPGWDSRGLEK